MEPGATTFACIESSLTVQYRYTKPLYRMVLQIAAVIPKDSHRSLIFDTTGCALVLIGLWLIQEPRLDRRLLLTNTVSYL